MIDLTQLLLALITGAFSIAALVIPYIINARLKDKQAAEVLSNAVINAIGAMRQAADGSVRALAPKVMIPGLSPDIAVGVSYMLNHAGEEAARFGITPEKLAEKINARIGVEKIAADAGAVLVTPPVPVVPPVTSTLATAPIPGVGGQPMMPMRLPIPPRFPENAP